MNFGEQPQYTTMEDRMAIELLEDVNNKSQENDEVENMSRNHQFSSFMETNNVSPLVRENNHSGMMMTETSFNVDNVDSYDYGDDEFNLGEDNIQNTTETNNNSKEKSEDDEETLLQTNLYSEDMVEQFIKGEDFAGLSKEIEKLLESDNATPRLGNQTTHAMNSDINAEYSYLSNNSDIEQDGKTNMVESNNNESSSFITDEEAEERLRSLLMRLDKSQISETSNNRLNSTPKLIPTQERTNTKTRLVPDMIELSLETTTSPPPRESVLRNNIDEVIEKEECFSSSLSNQEIPVHTSSDDYLFENISSNYNALNQGESFVKRESIKKAPALSNSEPSTSSLSSLINENINQNIINVVHQEKEVEISTISTIYEENNINNLIEMKLEPISQLLRSSGYAGFLGESDIVQRIKETFKMMLEDMERKTKTIELQSKNQQEFTKTMLKLKQQVEKSNEVCNQYKIQLEKKDNELKAFKDNNQVSNSKSEKEITQLKKMVEGMNGKVAQYESTITIKDEEINDLKKKMYHIVSKEETKRVNSINIFYQFNKRKPASKSDMKELDLIAMYEEQRTQLKREVTFLKSEIQRLNESEVQNQNETEEVQKNEEQIKKLITQVRMERERNAKIETEFNTAQQKLSAIVNQNQRVITNLEEENTRLLNELKGRPHAEDFESLRQKSEALRKELITKDKELTELKKSVDKSSVLTIPGGKWSTTPDKRKKQTGNASLQTSFENEAQKELLLYKDIIEEVCKILNISEITGLVASLQKMVSIVKAVPKMEKFICEICDICKKGTVDLGHEIDLKPKVVAPLLNYWIEKLRENQEMEKEITHLLNSRNGKPTIDYSDPDYKEIKRLILSSIEELVKNTQ